MLLLLFYLQSFVIIRIFYSIYLACVIFWNNLIHITAFIYYAGWMKWYVLSAWKTMHQAHKALKNAVFDKIICASHRKCDILPTAACLAFVDWDLAPVGCFCSFHAEFDSCGLRDNTYWGRAIGAVCHHVYDGSHVHLSDFSFLCRHALDGLVRVLYYAWEKGFIFQVSHKIKFSCNNWVGALLLRFVYIAPFRLGIIGSSAHDWELSGGIFKWSAWAVIESPLVGCVPVCWTAVNVYYSVCPWNSVRQWGQFFI